jgi:histone H2B
MPPKGAAAEKKPATKAPAQKAPVEKKDAAGKKTAATGDKKKRTKTRKETYSSYIYKGMNFSLLPNLLLQLNQLKRAF